MEKIINFYRWWRHSWLFKPTIYFIIFLAVICFIDQFIMPSYVMLGKEEELPNVLEMQVDEAKDLLFSRGFQVIIKDSLYDGHHPIGTVMEQNPYPNATVKKGRRVYLSISIGEEPITVPDLFGKSFRNAKLMLKSYNLNCYPIYQYSERYPADVVIGQYPAKGEQIKPGAKISVNVSLGKKKEGMVMPNFIDKSLYEVKEQIAELGLRLGNIQYENRKNILPETVLSQSLPPGSMLEPNTVIDLVVSKLE
jgi:beta-lactam-binding protein with PASTA domain